MIIRRLVLVALLVGALAGCGGDPPIVQRWALPTPTVAASPD